jgi:hypothetical protein
VASFSYSYTIGATDTDLRQSLTAQYPGSSAVTTFYC